MKTHHFKFVLKHSYFNLAGTFMARLLRIILPDQPHHIIQRGNNRQAIFLSNQDHEFYLEKLAICANRNDCRIHAYVQMTNHVHLLASPKNAAALGKTMQMLGRYYVRYFNDKYQRTGTLLEDRYKSSLIDSEQYLFTCMRYIELNPVRAGMVQHPSHYCWSSFHHNALGKTDSLIEPHEKYSSLGENLQSCQENYWKLFEHPLQQEVLDLLRLTASRCRVLGSDQFKQTVSTALNRHLDPAVRGGDRKSKSYQEKINLLRPQ